MWKFPKLPFYASVGAIPESYLLSLSYEEQILWLCSQVQAIKEGTPNYNYELLENKPSINNIPLIGNLTPEQLGLSNDYSIISNKPLINGVIVSGNKSGTDYGLQNQLIAGSGISIVGNTISATGGGSGGTTDYNDLSNKPSLNLVTIEGNKEYRDYGIQPQLQTNISSDLTLGYTYDISNLSVNDIILPYTSDSSEVKYSAIRQVTSDGACKILDVKNGERYYFRGVVQFLGIGENNKVIIKWNNPDNIYVEDSEYTATENMTLLVSFFDISTQVNEPRILQVQMGESMAESHLRNEISTNEAKYDIEKLILQTAEYKSKTLNAGKYIDFDVNRQLIEINQLNTSSLLIDLSENPIYNKIKIKGKAIGNYMFLFADSTREVIKLCPQNLAYFDEYIYLDIPEEATYLAISFFDTNNFAPSLEVIEMADTKGEANFYTEIDENLVLNYDGSTNVTLESGKYYRLMPTRSLAYYKDVSGTPTLDSANDMKNSILYYAETSSSKSLTITGVNEHNNEYIYQRLFWLDSSNGWHYSTLETDEVIQNGVSSIPQSTRSTIPTSGNDNDVPTISAVRNYVGSQSGSNFYTEIDENLVLNYDGSINVALESGKYYRLMPTRSLAYYKDVSGTPTLDSANDMKNSILYYAETSSSKSLTITGVNEHNNEYIYQRLFWLDSSNGWHYSTLETDEVIQNGVSSIPQSTRSTIPTSGNDNDVPTISAVRSYVTSQNIPVITYGTTDLTAGTSSLDTGTFYFVYE